MANGFITCVNSKGVRNKIICHKIIYGLQKIHRKEWVHRASVSATSCINGDSIEKCCIKCMKDGKSLQKFHKKTW